MSSRKPRVVGNMHVFVDCKIDVVNKQLVSPLSSNNLLSETLLGEPYILTIYRHLDAKEKHSLGVEGGCTTYIKYILCFSTQFFKVHSYRY